jgi:hypothetical protein
MKANFMGADGFEAGTDVWGIAKKGLKNAPASLWSSGTRKELKEGKENMLREGDHVRIQVDMLQGRGSLSVNGLEVLSFVMPLGKSYVMGASLSDDARVMLTELGYKRQTSPAERNLAAMWRSARFTDGVVKCQGREFRIHRAYLAEASPVFSVAFDSSFQESANATLDIQDADPDEVEAVLAYIYTGELLEGVDYAAIMAVAHRYELHDLLQVCSLRLEKDLFPETAALTLRSLGQFQDDSRVAYVFRRVKDRIQGTQELFDGLVESLK